MPMFSQKLCRFSEFDLILEVKIMSFGYAQYKVLVLFISIHIGFNQYSVNICFIAFYYPS